MPPEVISLYLVYILINSTFTPRDGHSIQKKLPWQRHGTVNFCAAAGTWGHEGTEDRDVEREKTGKERLTGWLIPARTWLGVCSQSLPPSGSTENLHHFFSFFFSFEEVQFNSVQSLSRVHSLRPHELQHARPPCPSPTPEFTETHVH